MPDPEDPIAGDGPAAGAEQRPRHPCPACGSDEHVIRAAAVPRNETADVVFITQHTRQAAGAGRVRVIRRTENVTTLEPGNRLGPGLPARPGNPLAALWTRAKEPLLVVLAGLLMVSVCLVIGIAVWVAPYSGYTHRTVIAVRVFGTLIGAFGAAGLAVFITEAWRYWHGAPARAGAAPAVAAAHQRAWYCRSCLAAYFDPGDAPDGIEPLTVIELEDYAAALWRAAGYDGPL
jgi:hypothetical protein